MYLTGEEEGLSFAPSDTPYRTPPRSRSPQLRHRPSISVDMSSSPLSSSPQGLPLKRLHDLEGSAAEEKISPLDPRRFTPSLHASLVAEILSLRRDVERKRGDIEQLETSLQSTRDECESLQITVTSTTKESHSLRRQLQRLEGGTASAMNELSEERDRTVNEIKDLKQRQEQFQRKARGQEEIAERTQMLWDRDRDMWDNEKRALETKIHIVEGRLKVISSEIANSHLTNGQTSQQHGGQTESPTKVHRRRGSAASLRSVSFAARRRDSEISSGILEADAYGHRLSSATLTNIIATSLADELALDEEGEDDWEHDNTSNDDQFGPDELLDGRSVSALSRPLDHKARKVLGLAPDDSSTGAGRKEYLPTQPFPRLDMPSRVRLPCQAGYSSAESRPRPPSAPTISSPNGFHKSTDEGIRMAFFAGVLSPEEAEVAMRECIAPEPTLTPAKTGRPMISTSCQTVSELPTPPRTPLDVQDPTDEDLPHPPVPQPRMITAATQTDVTHASDTVEEAVADADADRKFQIPAIAIHPPLSRPTTPTGSVVLPPHTKNAACQTDIAPPTTYTSSSIQTEESGEDDLTTRLPRRRPSPTILSHRAIDRSLQKLSTTEASNPYISLSARRKAQQPRYIRMASQPTKLVEMVAEDDLSPPTSEIGGPSEYDRSLDEQDDKRDSIESDAKEKRFDEDDIFSRPTAKFTLRAGRMVAIDKPDIDYRDVFDKIGAETDEVGSSSVEDLPAMVAAGTSARRTRQDKAGKGRPVERRAPALRSTSSRQFDIRKAALISSGAAAHQSSADSDPIAQVKPPFPVPTRHSSRKVPISVSEGAQSPTPAGRSPRRRHSRGRKAGLRKVRSTANITESQDVEYQASDPPPPPPDRSYGATKAQRRMPDFVCGDASLPFGLVLANSNPRPSPVQRGPPSRAESSSAQLQQTTVVGAIAETMVGEWMFKYVRRRRSFGVPEPKVQQEWDLLKSGDDLSSTITSSGIRHKRWVWLAPYERAVMWSSKQPTSGSALMGKSGRKLQIQSVLDVRDDTPLPRGSSTGPPFHRSILILTAERALKFTATSQERHHIWLTALSFLSHSPLGIGDLPALPYIPEQDASSPQRSSASLRRNPIRDSIRVAKGRDIRGGSTFGGRRSATTDGVTLQHRYYHQQQQQESLDRELSSPTPETLYESFSDAADAPTIRRYHTHVPSHSRKRSNTGPRIPPPPPPTSFRKFSNPPVPPSSLYSMTTAASSEIPTPSVIHSQHGQNNNNNSSSVGVGGWQSAMSGSSRRGSEASGSASNNGGSGAYVDPNSMPTMRMRAFIGEQSELRHRGS